MIDKKDLRILSMMLEKIKRLVEIIQNHSKEEILNNFVFSDAVQFEFEKLYEDTTRLSIEFKILFESQLHIDDLRGIRNRVAHNYETVSVSILIDTIQNDLPKLKDDIEKIIGNNT